VTNCDRQKIFIWIPWVVSHKVQDSATGYSHGFDLCKTDVADPHLSYHKVLSWLGHLVLSLYVVSLGITLPLPSD
jgi:hypothetical protein